MIAVDIDVDSYLLSLVVAFVEPWAGRVPDHQMDMEIVHLVHEVLRLADNALGRNGVRLEGSPRWVYKIADNLPPQFAHLAEPIRRIYS